MENVEALSQVQSSTLTTNKLIRNTYTLLGLTLVFSAIAAFVSMSAGMPRINPIIYLVVAFGLLFLTSKFRNSGLGIVCVFGFTGFLGASLGPILSLYLAIPNGGTIVMEALGATAVAFFGLSAYAFTTRKDFSFMGGFLFVGLLVAIVAGLAGYFLHLPNLQLAVSAACVLIFSGFILFDTSRMIHGHETNYIMLTLSLYLDIYNLFTSLLHIIGAFSGDD